MTEKCVQGILLLLFTYISLVPFYYMQEQSLTQIPTISAVKYLPFVLTGLGLLICINDWAKRSRRLFYSPVFLFVGVYLGCSMLSLVGSEYAKIGLVKWVYYNITGCVICFVVAQYDWHDARRLGRFMAFVSGIVVVYTFLVGIIGEDAGWGVMQSTFNPYYTRARVAGPFGHTVATASYVMFLMPVAVWMWINVDRFLPKVLWGFVCCLYVLVILLTQTRGALLASGMCFILMTPWWRKAGEFLLQNGRRRKAAVAVISVAVLLSMWGVSKGNIAWVRFDKIKHRWSDLLDLREIRIRDQDKEYHYRSMLEYTERFRIAQYFTVRNILREHAVLGVGFGTFTRSFERFKHTENYIEAEFSEHTTENMYLMFLAETGWLGLGSRLALMAAILTVLFRTYRHSAQSEQRDFLLAYLSGAGGLAFNMLTWDVLNEPTLRMSYWMFTGLAIAASKDVKDRLSTT